MQALIWVVLPVFLVIGAGYASAWRGSFGAAAVDGLMRFAQGVALPCLLFLAIARLDLGESFRPALLGSFYGGAALCFAVATAGARAIFGRDWEDSVAIGFVGLFSNSLLLGLPITERAYGPGALAGNYAIVALHSPFCYALGITAMEIARARGAGPLRLVATVLRAMGRNALILGIALGFAVNLAGLPVPGPLEAALELLARAGLPAALFALGGVLWRYRPEGDLRTIGFVVAVSLLLHPAAVWALAGVSGLEVDGLRSAVLTAAMAPGINTYLFANIYGRARRVAASAVLLGTAASIPTIWIWLALLP